jgi:arylsulfatase A-like enzyme
VNRLSIVTAAVVAAALPAAARAAHPVFDLVANRTLAHGIRGGGLAIAAGSPGFARYVHFSRPLPTWKLRLVEDGKRVAVASTSSVLEVPLTAEQARGASAITLRLKSNAKQTVRVSGNGKSSAAVPIGLGWSTVRVPLEAGALVAGENKLTLTFAQGGMYAGQKGAAAVEWIQIGGEAPSEAAPVVAEGGALVLAKDGGLAWYVKVPEGGALLAQGDAGGCGLKVRVGDGRRALVEAPLTLGTPVALAAAAGKVARLELVADGAGCTRAKLTQAALLADGAAPTVSYAKRPRNVIVWLTDSTRADKYKAFNPKTRVETAFMDEWQKRATLFTVAYVQGNESRVSHASLFTGMYPAQHRFIPEKAKLSADFVTLPEVAKAAGLKTAGFMGNGFIRASWGFGDGWDLLQNHIQLELGLTGADIRKAGQSWLDKNHTSPFFVYLGTIDAHVSWKAHAPWIQKYDPEPYSGPYVKALLDPTLDKIVAGQVKLSERDKVRVVALYDSDVSYNDQQFGELVKALEKLGRLEDTMIVLTADHGEEMFERGKIGHGQSLHEELVHVPLAIYFPPLFPPGKKVTEGVEVLDVLPTIADALGTKLPPDVQGMSLVPLAQGEGAGYPRPAIASQYELAHTMRLDRWKLWVGGSGEVKLFDMVADPGALKELGPEHAVERRFVADALGLWMAYQGKWKKTRWGVASNHTPQLAADLEQ